MSILVDSSTRLLVQGITGREGSFHARACRDAGTNLVAGVVPGRGGELFDGQTPIFNTVEQAVRETSANASLIFVPPPFAADACLEAIDARIGVVACITEGIPILDTMRVKRYLADKPTVLIGPNCPGLITPGQCKMGIMPASIHLPGFVGLVSRSGTLTYEAVAQLTSRGIGQTTCVGIGGDPIIGTSFVDVLSWFQDDPETKAIMLIGEIGGPGEALAAEFIKQAVTKPVVGFIAGQTAPPGRRMGHAGAIVSGGNDTAAAKMRILSEAGVTMSASPTDIGVTMERVLKEKGLL